MTKKAPTPHLQLSFWLDCGGCLVLAPDVSFLLISRKQGCPSLEKARPYFKHWCSASSCMHLRKSHVFICDSVNVKSDMRL